MYSVRRGRRGLGSSRPQVGLVWQNRWPRASSYFFMERCCRSSCLVSCAMWLRRWSFAARDRFAECFMTLGSIPELWLVNRRTGWFTAVCFGSSKIRECSKSLIVTRDTILRCPVRRCSCENGVRFRWATVASLSAGSMSTMGTPAARRLSRVEDMETRVCARKRGANPSTGSGQAPGHPLKDSLDRGED